MQIIPGKKEPHVFKEVTEACSSPYIGTQVAMVEGLLDLGVLGPHLLGFFSWAEVDRAPAQEPSGQSLQRERHYMHSRTGDPLWPSCQRAAGGVAN